jgi:hypothetical protein
LAEIKQSLLELEPAETIEEIERLLESGLDRPTQLSFEIGSDQSLTAWPTLRTFILDLLIELDPEAASRISRGILTEPTTPDEWAIALRNIASVDTAAEDIGYLKLKTRQLIDVPAWRRKPTIGYLNAFDLLVHTADFDATPRLSRMIREPDHPAVTHAGFLTLDRLVLKDSTEMLDHLARDEELNRTRPEMVAQMFARADLRSEDQVRMLRGWLLDPERPPVQIEAFAGIFPNSNLMISNNLLTKQAIPLKAELDQREREALKVVERWQDEPEFQHLRPHLDSIVARLQSRNSLEHTGEVSPGP